MGDRRFNLVVFCVTALIVLFLSAWVIERQEERELTRYIELVRLAERGPNG